MVRHRLGVQSVIVELRDTLDQTTVGFLELAADVFNLTNNTNFAIPTGNQTSAQYLLLTAYNTSYTPRKLQIGARIQF